ncbi:hypothetical protein D6789_03635 [Candidatus Woesearchaeota archaeon]|nr:MAG: hypothetical protein D6789_03635 [Candidatus Woesearchaeota archaeon]
MRVQKERLRERGWTGKEIKHAERILLKAAQKQHPGYRFLERAVFWGLLFLTVVAVFTISLVVWIAAALLDTFTVTAVLVIFGLVLGTLYTLVASDIDWLEHHHHAFAGAALATTAIVTSSIIGTRLAIVSKVLGEPAKNTWLPGLLFACALLTPHFSRLWLERTRTTPARRRKKK